MKKQILNICWLIGLFIMSCNPKTTTDITNTNTPEPKLIEGSEKTEEAEEEESKKMVVTQEDALNMDLPQDKAVKTGTLSNGMKYYIRANQKPEKRAELRLVVNAGAMQEEDDQQGLAHFIEHMAFNGTKHFKKSELVDYLETIGMRFGPDLNAYTSFDETVYMLQIPTDDKAIMDKGFLILEDWASGLLLEGEEIDKERGVVVSEWRTGLGASERMRQAWWPKVFYKSRYADRLPIGKKEIIENADYATFERFYKKWYRPDLMAVVVVGDVDVIAMEEEIKTRFEKIEKPSAKVEKENYPVPNHDETFVAIASDEEATYGNIQILYKHDKTKGGTVKSFKEDLKRQLYNRMLNARLDELTQLPKPPFIAAYSGYSQLVRTKNAYNSLAYTGGDNMTKALETLLVENERVKRFGFNQSEMDRQKKDLMRSLEKALSEKDKTESRRFASLYVSNFLEKTPMVAIEDRMNLTQQWLHTILLEDINILAKKWISDKNRSVIITGPKKEGVKLPSETAVRKILATVPNMDIQPYEDEVVEGPLLAIKLEPQAIENERKFESINVTEWTLSNGVRVVVKPTDFKNDQILLRAYSEGGHSLVEDENYLSATFSDYLVDQSGLGNFTYSQLEKKLAGTVVGITPYVGEMYEGMTGTSSNKDLETMLQMAYMYFKDTRKDAEAFQSIVTKQRAQLKNLKASPQFFFMDKVRKITTNEHPRRMIPTEADLEKLDMDKSYAVYQDRFADASDFTFVLVGSFELDRVKPLVQTYLGNLPSINRTETWKDVNVTYPKGKVVETFKKGKAPQSMVNIQFKGEFDWSLQNNYDFQAMIAVLRIMMRESMREDKGGVYGVRVSGSAFPTPKPEYDITVSFMCAPENVEELIATAMKDIKTLQTEGPSVENITKVQESQRRSREKSLKQNSFWARQLESVYKNKLSPTQLLEYDQRIESLKGEAIQRTAQKHLNMEAYIQLVLMPE